LAQKKDRLKLPGGQSRVLVAKFHFVTVSWLLQHEIAHIEYRPTAGRPPDLQYSPHAQKLLKKLFAGTRNAQVVADKPLNSRPKKVDFNQAGLCLYTSGKIRQIYRKIWQISFDNVSLLYILIHWFLPILGTHHELAFVR
jgi:hypothetical protein